MSYRFDIELDTANRQSCIDIPIIDDSQLEDEKTLDVILYQPETGGELDLPLLSINPAIVTISIVNDDCKFLTVLQ